MEGVVSLDTQLQFFDNFRRQIGALADNSRIYQPFSGILWDMPLGKPRLWPTSSGILG